MGPEADLGDVGSNELTGTDIALRPLVARVLAHSHHGSTVLTWDTKWTRIGQISRCGLGIREWIWT